MLLSKSALFIVHTIILSCCYSLVIRHEDSASSPLSGPTSSRPASRSLPSTTHQVSQSWATQSNTIPADDSTTVHSSNPSPSAGFDHQDKPPGSGRKCQVSTEHASPHFLDTIQALHEQDLNGSASKEPKLSSRQTGTTTINTYFHVISDIWSAASVTRDMIANQLQTLNSEYQPSGFQFNLISTTFTVDDAWAVGSGSNMQDAMNALRQGSYSDLNLFFHTNLTGGILGSCSLPSALPSDKASLATAISGDGCNIHAGTMPGASIYGYNLGKTAVHETGHWLGLLHTFEGYSCSGSGDYIADTKQESVSTEGCPTTPAKNSCPSDGADSDPIHNYMDYSSDSCYNKFTTLQNQRMLQMWTTYRVGH